jgi:transposase
MGGDRVLGMKTLSLDFRERILAAYDAGEGTRDKIAQRFRISLGMVKKLLQQRRRTGDIAPRHHFSGCKPKILERHRQQLRRLLSKQPDLTLGELRTATRLNCTLPAIHYVLAAMDLTYKKNAARQRARPGRHRRRARTMAAEV